MPRIRTIKPDAFLSESLSTLGRGTRWTFAGLWTYSDDEGRARDDVRLIKAALYPLDDSVSRDDVETDLWLLAGIGAICRYVGDDGRRYLHMPKWEDHQRINRPSPSKLPACPHEGSGKCHEPRDDDSVSPHGALTEDSRQERKGREGNREGEGNLLADKSADAPPPRFEEFWDTYGLKVKRPAAIAAYRKALTKTTDDVLISAAAAYVLKIQADRRRRGDRATQQAHASSWLNDERWGDEVDVPLEAPPESNAQGWLRLASEMEPQDNVAPFRQIGGAS